MNNVAAILQATFLNVLSSMPTAVIQMSLKCVPKGSISSDNVLVPNTRQETMFAKISDVIWGH